jgi:hypothetical protein
MTIARESGNTMKVSPSRKGNEYDLFQKPLFNSSSKDFKHT